MNQAEVTILTRYVKAMCPAQMIDDLTPDAWLDVIGDLRLEDCRAAVTALKRGNNPPAFIDVGEIRKVVRAIRSDRIDRAGHYEPASGLTLLEWNRRAADGVQLPAAPRLKQRDMRAIEGTFQEIR